MGRSSTEASEKGEILLSVPDLSAPDKVRLLEEGKLIYLYNLSYKKPTVNLSLLFHLFSEKFNTDILMSTEILKACTVASLH